MNFKPRSSLDSDGLCLLGRYGETVEFLVQLRSGCGSIICLRVARISSVTVFSLVKNHRLRRKNAYSTEYAPAVSGWAPTAASESSLVSLVPSGAILHALR